jgi:hypothetical protein
VTGSRLIALRIARPEEWGEIVRSTVASLGVGRGAVAMGVSCRTAGRWVAELGIATPNGGKRVGAGRKKKNARCVNQSAIGVV